MRYIAEVRFIGSIYPGELPVVTRYYGPSIHATGKGAERRTDFRLTPVPRGDKPFILPVYDSFEQVLDVMAMSGNQGNPQKPRQSKPVPVEEIIGDVISMWTGRLANVPDGAKPGVGEVHLLDKQVAEFQRTGVLPDSVVNSKFSGIPQEEYQQLITQQTAYFEYWFSQAELVHARDPQSLQAHGQITETMRLAADWLGHRRPWTNKDYVLENEPCPLCTALVPKTAVVCPTCHNQIREMPAHIAALQGGAPRPAVGR